MDWHSKVVLITGGTGAFGRKFTEILLREYRPRKLIIFSRDELKQHEMRQVFPDDGDLPIRYFIGDVRDRERLYRAFHGVDIIVHTAALKQVPACEYNPFEAVQTNVLGAKNVIDAAIDRGVKLVMAVSTDKAVNPVNLYGATKLCAEKIFVHANAYSGAEGTKFSASRYGNVVGSRGSVIPLFLKQRQNGTVTVTDPRMTRLLITLEQGVRFVIRCLELMHGGEIFVPKIPSVNIMDLVKVVAPDCEVKVIGIRSGEKLHEVLISEDEARQAVEWDDMYVIKPSHPWWKVENWSAAKPLPDGFRFASDTNPRWLTADEIQSLIP
ncbi:MAG: UDP-N-acetylglucosamine 4,6-dehydratase (inverting) [Chloroflexi bacterium]|nr:UDP-N-acetylglucosamine 4,6-dehydratase (inverting) [Chloroflexota bacterium]